MFKFNPADPAAADYAIRERQRGVTMPHDPTSFVLVRREVVDQLLRYISGLTIDSGVYDGFAEALHAALAAGAGEVRVLAFGPERAEGAASGRRVLVFPLPEEGAPRGE